MMNLILWKATKRESSEVMSSVYRVALIVVPATRISGTDHGYLRSMRNGTVVARQHPNSEAA